MKINFANVNFKGIVPPYVRNGYKITPISQIPSQKEIADVISSTKSQKYFEGNNGRVYFWGEDLVVKKYKDENEAYDYNPWREIETLDKMNIQKR